MAVLWPAKVSKKYFICRGGFRREDGFDLRMEEKDGHLLTHFGIVTEGPIVTG